MIAEEDEHSAFSAMDPLEELLPRFPKFTTYKP